MPVQEQSTEQRILSKNELRATTEHTVQQTQSFLQYQLKVGASRAAAAAKQHHSHKLSCRAVAAGTVTRLHLVATFMEASAGVLRSN